MGIFNHEFTTAFGMTDKIPEVGETINFTGVTSYGLREVETQKVEYIEEIVTNMYYVFTQSDVYLVQIEPNA